MKTGAWFHYFLLVSILSGITAAYVTLVLVRSTHCSLSVSLDHEVNCNRIYLYAELKKLCRMFQILQQSLKVSFWPKNR